jgi:hypothetical protein
MKYLLAFVMLATLVVAFMFAQLGYNYETEGYGLHPMLAGIGALFMLYLGWMSSSLLADLEEQNG